MMGRIRLKRRGTVRMVVTIWYIAKRVFLSVCPLENCMVFHRRSPLDQPSLSAVAPPGGKGGSFPPMGGRPKIM